jgi:hypothetical protein
MPGRLRDDFDAWARLSARLLRRSIVERARIIHDASADGEWAQADAHWYGVLVEDTESGRTDRIDKYRLLCVEAMGARRRSGEGVASPLDHLRPPSEGDGTPAFAQPFATAKAIKPAPGQVGTGMSMGTGAEGEAVERARLWPLEQYAWLCAELEQYPQREDHVWGMRGITTTAAQRVVQSMWGARLDADTQLRDRYDDLIRTYREAIRRR